MIENEMMINNKEQDKEQDKDITIFIRLLTYEQAFNARKFFIETLNLESNLSVGGMYVTGTKYSLMPVIDYLGEKCPRYEIVFKDSDNLVKD